MPDHEKQLYEDIGSLKAAADTTNDAIKDVRASQKELDKKLDSIASEIRNLGVVSRVDWEKRNEYVDGKFASVEVRLDAIEDRHALADGSFYRRIGKALDSKLVTLIAGGLLVFILWMAFVVAQQELNNNGFSPVGVTRE